MRMLIIIFTILSLRLDYNYINFSSCPYLQILTCTLPKSLSNALSLLSPGVVTCMFVYTYVPKYNLLSLYNTNVYMLSGLFICHWLISWNALPVRRLSSSFNNIYCSSYKVMKFQSIAWYKGLALYQLRNYSFLVII